MQSLNTTVSQLSLKLDSRELPARIVSAAEYHEKIFKENFPDLPYKTDVELAAMDVVLKQKNVAISMVFNQIRWIRI